MAMVAGQIVVLVAFNLVIAFTTRRYGRLCADGHRHLLRAFGWPLCMELNDALSIAAITILVAVIATSDSTVAFGQ